MKPFALLFSSCFIIASIAGCSSSPQTPQVAKTGETNGDTNCVITQSTKGCSFSTSLKGYLDAASESKDQSRFWCKATVDLAKDWIAVRSTKVLAQEDVKRTQDFGVVNGKLFTIQVESSTKGGAPIIKNWYLSMTKEENGQPCIRTLNAAD